MTKEQNIFDTVNRLRKREIVLIGFVSAVLSLLLQFVCLDFSLTMREKIDMIIVPYNVIFITCLLFVGILFYVDYRKTNNVKYRNWSFVFIGVMIVDALLKLALSLGIKEIGLSANVTGCLLIIGIVCMVFGLKRFPLFLLGLGMIDVVMYEGFAKKSTQYVAGMFDKQEAVTLVFICLLLSVFLFLSVYMVRMVKQETYEKTETKELKEEVEMIEKEIEIDSSKQTMIETADETINHVPFVLQELYAEMKRKNVQDIETWHNIDTMMKRVAVVYETYNKLSKTEQKNMEEEIVAIISHCQNEMQMYIQAEDEILKQEIRKMKHIICK